MAWRGALGKGESAFPVDIFRRGGRARQGVAFVEPLGEIAVAAAGRGSRCAVDFFLREANADFLVR